MLRAIYISHSARPMSEKELMQILSRARLRNKPAGISGMLLYSANTFLQVLEGPEQAVEGLLDRVFHDPRHRNMKVIERKQASQRHFPDWSMGYQCLAPQTAKASGFFDLTRDAIAARAPVTAGEDILRYMRGFAEAKVAQ